MRHFLSHHTVATVAPCTGKLVDPLPASSFSASSQAVGYPASSGHMSSGSRWCSQTANTNQYLQVAIILIKHFT